MTEYKFKVKRFNGGGFSELTRTVRVEDCSNLTKGNWCLLRETECPLLVKHEHYSFNKADVKCSYLESGYTASSNKLENPHKEEILNSIVDSILVERLTKLNAYPDNGPAVYAQGKYRKTCKRCDTHFKTDAKNKVYCCECTEKRKNERHRKYNCKR